MCWAVLQETEETQAKELFSEDPQNQNKCQRQRRETSVSSHKKPLPEVWSECLLQSEFPQPSRTHPVVAVWWRPRPAYPQALGRCTRVCSSWHPPESAWSLCSPCREPWLGTQALYQWETCQKPPSPLQQRLRNDVAPPSWTAEPTALHALTARLSHSLRWESAGVVQWSSVLEVCQSSQQLLSTGQFFILAGK